MGNLTVVTLSMDKIVLRGRPCKDPDKQQEKMNKAFEEHERMAKKLKVGDNKLIRADDSFGMIVTEDTPSFVSSKYKDPKITALEKQKKVNQAIHTKHKEEREQQVAELESRVSTAKDVQAELASRIQKQTTLTKAKLETLKKDGVFQHRQGFNATVQMSQQKAHRNRYGVSSIGSRWFALVSVNLTTPFRCSNGRATRRHTNSYE